MPNKKKRENVAQEQKGKTSSQTIDVLGVAAKEGWEILTPGQYLHVKDLIKQLVGFGRREFESNLKIGPFGDYWELKDKGGTLGKINIRVYFAFESDLNKIVVLHTYKKEDDGQAPPHIKQKLNNRFRLYKQGHFKENTITYERSV